MSVEKAIDLIDNSAKDKDPVLYKLSLLVRTLKSNKFMPEFVDQLGEFYTWMQGQPEEMQEKIWIPHFKNFLNGLASTSSENGWLMDIITQVRVNYRGNSPESRKFALLKGHQQAEQQNTAG